MNTTAKAVCVIQHDKELYNMKTAKKVCFSSLLQEHHREVTEAICDLIKSHVLDPIRHELWIYVDYDGNVSLRDNIGYASTRISNEQRCFIFACGGENITAWNLIPKLHSLLNKEEIYDYLTEISAKTGTAIEEITVQEVQDYIQKTYPGLIEQWLDEYFYNEPSEYLENRVQRIYESIISKLDGYEE